MKTMLQLKRDAQGTRDLQTVVKAMKTMAAANIYQYEEAVRTLGETFHILEQGFQILLQSPEPDGNDMLGRTFYQSHIQPNLRESQPLTNEHPAGLIVFGAEQGMSGHFNQQIITFMQEQVQQQHIDLTRSRLQPLGSRLPLVLESFHGNIGYYESLITLPGALPSVAPMIEQLALRINQWQEQNNIQQILIFYHRSRSNATYEPHMMQLLPLDEHWLEDLAKRPWPNRQIPSYSVSGLELFRSLVKQYLSVSLFRAFAESLASENASRLSAMQLAEKKIEQRLGQLQQTLNQQRQTQITEEVLDLVAGYEALGTSRS